MVETLPEGSGLLLGETLGVRRELFLTGIGGKSNSRLSCLCFPDQAGLVLRAIH